MTFLAVDPKDIFGTLNPPPAVAPYSDPVTGLPKLIKLGVNAFILISGLALLLYMLWGALDWISSGGEKEKLSKAQNKITNAIIGMILVFVVIVVFGLIAGDILGIFHKTGNGWVFTLPTAGP